MIQFVDFSRGDIGINSRMLQKRSGASSFFFLAFLLVLCSLAMPVFSLHAHSAKNSSASSGASLLSTNVFGIGISSFSPSSIAAGSNSFQLRIYLSGRVTQSIPTVYFNAPLTVLESNLNDILVEVPASAVANAGTYQISVTDPATGTTGYANFNVIQQANPEPSIGTLNPSSVQAGSGSFSLTINGRGFVNNVTQFTFNGLPLTNPSTLGFTYAVFTIPASYAVNAGTIQVSAVNPTPGGGFASQTFTILANNPVPVINSVSQSSAGVGSSSSFGTAYCSGLITSTQVTIIGPNGQPVTTYGPISVNVSNQTINWGFQPQQYGTYTMQVTNPAPGGGTATYPLFTLSAPAPSINSFSPTSLIANGDAQTLTISGSNFSGASVLFNGYGVSLISGDASTLQVSIPGYLLANAGAPTVRVTNSDGQSASSSISVTAPDNPVPQVGTLNPSSIQAGSGSFQLTVNGWGFVSGVTQFTFNGQSLGTPSSLHLTYAIFNVPASYIANAGPVQITATNPAPGGGSASGLFTITPPPFSPTIQSISPSPIITNGQPQNLTINGAHFSGVTVFFNNTVVQLLSANANTIQVNVPPTLLIAGTYNLTVTNFDGRSVSFPVVVQSPPVSPNPPPVISAFSPSSLPANSLTQTLIISGDKFSSPSVTFNGSPVQIISNTPTSIQISIPGNLLSTPGSNFPIRVTNVDGQSVSSSITVYDPNPAPIISSFNPIVLLSNNSAQTLVINGNNFSNGASVSLNGVAVQVTTNNNPYTIEVNVPAFLLTAAANDVPVRVTNSDGKSTVMNINIITPQSLNPIPQITSLNPASVLAGSNDFALTINGSGFINGFTTFTFGFSDQPLVPISITESVAIVTVPKSYIAHANDYGVKAFNVGPGGGTGTGILTVVYPPAPTITSVSPTSLNPTGQQQNLTINGNDFYIPTVEFTGRNSSGVAITRTLQIVSANTTAIQVIVPADFLQQGGYSASIKVTNYGGEFAVYSPIPINTLANAIFSITPSSIPVQTPDNQTPVTVSAEVSDNTITSVIIAGTSVPVTITPAPPGVAGPYIMTFNIPANLVQTPGLLPVSYTVNGQTLTAEICVYPGKPTITKVLLRPSAEESNQIWRSSAAKGFVIVLEGTNFTSKTKFEFGYGSREEGRYIITPNSNLWNTDQWNPNYVVLLVNPDQIFGNRVRDSIRTALPYHVAALNESCTNNGGGSDQANVNIVPSFSPLSVHIGRPPLSLRIGGVSNGSLVSIAGGFGYEVNSGVVQIPTMFTPSSSPVWVYTRKDPPGSSNRILDSLRKYIEIAKDAKPAYELAFQIARQEFKNDRNDWNNIHLLYASLVRNQLTAIQPPPYAFADAFKLANSPGSFPILPPAAPVINSINGFRQGNIPQTIYANQTYVLQVLGEFTYFPTVSGNPPDIQRATYFEFYKNLGTKGYKLLKTVRNGSVSWSETIQQISASEISEPGIYTVKMVTPSDPSDPTSGGAILSDILIRSGRPVINDIVTSDGLPPVAGTIVNLSIIGSNFNPTTIVQVNGRVLPSTNVSFTEQRVSIPARYVPTSGDYTITVINPDETEHATRDFTLNAKPTASITSISPSSVTLPASGTTLLALSKVSANTQSSGDLTVTVLGSNFELGTIITINGRTFSATFIDSTRMTIVIPASMLANPAELRIIARNIGQATDTTIVPQPIVFRVKTPVPVLTALSSATTTATLDSRTWTLTVSGQNFFPGAKVIYNGTTLATSAVKVEGATSLRVVLPDVPITSAQYTLAVVNPSPTDSASNKLTLNVVYPQPVLHATLPVSPVTTTATLAPWMLTLRGGNFSDQAVVSIDGQSVPFVYVNSTQLKVPMPETVAIAARTYRIVITNPTPGGGSTDTLTVNVVHPTPVLDSLSITRTMAGSPVSIRLLGSRFASSAGVLLNGAPLTSGVTVESPTSILVALTGTQVRTVGNYNFSVNNPAPGGGTSSVRTLRVVPAFASTVEFSRVTTAIVAGSRLSNVTLRFRDESGNLTDFDGVLRFSNTTGTSTGTLSLRRSSIGVSTATATRFNLADTYTLSVDSVPAATGKRDFEVVPATDFSVVVSGVPTSQVAGATLPSFTLSYFDRLGNATDDRLGEVRIRHDQKGYLHVLPRTQTDEGVYITSPLPITTTGTYSVFVTGISVSNITGNRTVSIAPAATVLAEFQYVDSSFAAGSKQTAFRVTYRDSYGNLADGPTTVTASGTTELGTSTASIALTKISAGVYTAEATAFTVPGAYNLAIAGISQYSGQRVFSVTGLSAYYASVSTLPQTAIAGAQLGAFTIRLTDRLSNPITGNIGTVALRHSRGFYHALTTQAQANGQYSVSGMQLTTIGTYTISIGGIATENITGNRVITVEQAPVASAQFQYVDSSFNAGGKQVAFRVTYRDAFGNLLDGPESVTAVSGSSTSTITLTKISLGVYTAAVTAFTVPGAYTLSVAGISQYTGQRTFTVNSIAASNALVTGVSPALTAGTQLGTFTIRLTDSQNNPVSGNIGAVTLRHERGFTHTLLTQAQANGVYSVQGVPVTTVGTYTVNVGGIAAANITGNRAVMVSAAPLAVATFQYVDTLLAAGSKQTAFRVTYRDSFGNLVNGPGSVTASNGGTSTASVTLTQTSLGVYTAEQLAFTLVGNYTLTIAGVSQYAGARSFSVTPLAASNAEVSGVQAALTAGAQQGTITIRISDRYGNRISTNIGTVSIRHERGFMHVLPTQNNGEGVYMTTTPVQLTTVGTYTVNIAGITALNVTGNRSVLITPASVSSAVFQSVDTSITAGGKQVAFRVTYRDGYGNLVEGPTTVTASNGSSTASITLTSVSNGVYTAVSTPFTIAGNYSLTIAGVTLEGTRTFTVLPNGVATVEIRGVQASINKDAQQSGITLAIADRYGNPTDRASILRFTRTTTNPASTGTITLTRTALGVMTAEATAFSVVGTYRLSVDGISASALLGTTTFTVTTAATTASSFKGADAQLTTTQHNTETSVGASEEVVAGVMPLSVVSYPNPAVNEMELVVRLPREERVSITLRDNLGRVVGVVAETILKAGENRLQYNLSTIPSGAYSCMVQTMSGTTAARIMVVR